MQLQVSWGGLVSELGSWGWLGFRLHVQLGLAPLQVKAQEGLHVCSFWGTGWRGSSFLRKVPMATAEMQEGKPRYASIFEASPCSTFGKNLRSQSKLHSQVQHQKIWEVDSYPKVEWREYLLKYYLICHSIRRETGVNLQDYPDLSLFTPHPGSWG